MRELNGLSYAEIGSALTTSEAAARQSVYEARMALRELQGGREMQCEPARQAISEQDGRVLRGRRLRAHLRTCESCRDFRLGISQRRSDLRSLFPLLPGLAASGFLAAVLGEAGSPGGAAATGAAAGSGAGMAGGSALTGSAAVKGASIAAAVVIGAGAADISGVAKLPLAGERGAPATPTVIQGERGHGATGPTKAPGSHAQSAAGVSERPHGGASLGMPGRGQGRSVGRADGADGGRPGSPPRGRPSVDAGQGTLPATSNGTPPAHSQAGGASHGNGNAGASQPHGRSTGAAPGLAHASSNAPTLPDQARGRPGSPPGHASPSAQPHSHSS